MHSVVQNNTFWAKNTKNTTFYQLLLNETFERQLMQT